MAFRSVMISSPARLSTRNKRLVISQDTEHEIPLEDIAAIVVESQQVSLTVRLLAELADIGVVLYCCDEKHMPVGCHIPFQNHSRQEKMIEMQFGLSMPFRKRIWQQIIIGKLKNQAGCLKLADREGYAEIAAIAKQVASGDATGREAMAAKKYFRYLFGADYRRSADDVRNSAMNYGYAILRGAIARSLTAHGLIPARGIKHESELNNFNLADDFIEPFRPVVDLWTVFNINCNMGFDKERRADLVRLLHHDVSIAGCSESVINAIEIAVQSFITCMKENECKKLKLPELVALELHKYEE